jgi:hypothetical protein
MSSELLTNPPMVRVYNGEVVVIVTSTPTFTPTAARQTASLLLRAADEADSVPPTISVRLDDRRGR